MWLRTSKLPTSTFCMRGKPLLSLSSVAVHCKDHIALYGHKRAKASAMVLFQGGLYLSFFCMSRLAIFGAKLRVHTQVQTLSGCLRLATSPLLFFSQRKRDHLPPEKGKGKCPGPQMFTLISLDIHTAPMHARHETISKLSSPPQPMI